MSVRVAPVPPPSPPDGLGPRSGEARAFEAAMDEALAALAPGRADAAGLDPAEADEAWSSMNVARDQLARLEDELGAIQAASVQIGRNPWARGEPRAEEEMAEATREGIAAEIAAAQQAWAQAAALGGEGARLGWRGTGLGLDIRGLEGRIARLRQTLQALGARSP